MTDEPLKLLILGGTVFLGRHLVASALQAGHQITLFNRGKSNPSVYGNRLPSAGHAVEQIVGDRQADLDRLKGRHFDAVIDTCGYNPADVEKSCLALENSVERYIFISSISVYRTHGLPSGASLSEASPLVAQPVPPEEGNYATEKALCETAVSKIFAGRALILRPGLIVGPYDPTDRFTYWIRRIRRGGKVLAPGSPARPVQFIDARDLSDFIITLAQAGESGIFNGVGPDKPLTMQELLLSIKDRLANTSESLSHTSEFTWMTDQALLQMDVAPWMEMPLWLPEADETAAMLRVSTEKSLAAALKIRPLIDTIDDTNTFDLGRGSGYEAKAGLSSEKETNILSSFTPGIQAK
ncbi:MAG: NAD-dependent epimerase/dehydratase family protein [Candidatus Melainabacteria bacterium]|nr:NAD-dependent epimerase/dehydratase family protein [Candidatus Melainabacteria bacterium]